MDVLYFILAASGIALFLLHIELNAENQRLAGIFHCSISILLFSLAVLEILRIQGFWLTRIPSITAAVALAASAAGLLATLKWRPLPRPHSGNAALYAMLGLAGASLPWLEESIFILFGLQGLLFLRVIVRFRETSFETTRRRKWFFASCMGLLVIIGVSLAAVERQNSRDREMRENLLLHSRAVANALSFNELEKLLFTQEDAQNPVYQRLCKQMRDFARVSNSKSIYSIVRRNEKFLFGPESLLPGDPLSSPPGTEYFQPPFALYLTFLTGMPMATGPYTDEYGTFVSAFVPIVDESTRQIRLVVGMDIDTPEWNLKLARARLAPIGFGFLCLLLIFLLQSVLRKGPEQTARFFVTQHSHAFFVFLFGLVVTAYVAMSFHEEEQASRREAFQETALQRAFLMRKILGGVDQNELRALSRFFRSSERVMPQEFQTFANYLITRPHVHAAMYAARVPKANAGDFEARMRSYIQNVDYQIYPAAEKSENEDVYPVFMVEPNKAQLLLGYDLNTNAAIREALQFAQDTHSTAMSDAFAWPTETGREEILVALIRPMPPLAGMKEPTFAVLFVRHGPLLENVLEKTYPSLEERTQQNVVLDLYQIKDENIYFLSTTRSFRAGEPVPSPDSLLKSLYPFPIFAFGKTYLLFFSPGPMFEHMHPLRAGRLVAYAGFSLSLVISLLVGLILSWQRRLKMELERQRRGWERSEEKFQLLVEKSPLAIVVLLRGRIQYANGTALHLLECKDEKDLFDEAFSRFLSENVQKRFDEILESLEDGSKTVQMELSVCKKNIPCEIQFVRIMLEHKAGALLFIRDLTEQIHAQQENMRLQQQLEKSRKIESISRLANGVAHDFNNMLGVVLGAADMLLQQMPHEDPNRRDVLEIQVAAGRAADLVRRLLQFSRRQDGAAVLLDINRKIKMDLPLLTAPFSSRVSVRWEPAEALWLVRINPEQFSQALSILVKNACEAIAESGTVTVKTFNVVRAAPGSEQVSEFVVLSVADTGRGMETFVMEHLFEPFFSTKKPEEHAGLGLALLHAIVMQAGGFIEPQSRPGDGSTFSVFFPKAFCMRTQGKDSPPRHLPELSRSENRPVIGENVCVLCVDDENANLRIAVRVLEKAGFVAYAALSAQDALKIIDSDIRTLHVVVCDVALRDLPAMEFVQILRKRFPDIRVLLTSGYSYNALIEQGRMEPGQEFLAKPFSAEMLVRTIQRLVGQRTP